MIAAIDCRIDEETSAPLYNFVVLAANDGTSQHVLAQFSTTRAGSQRMYGEGW